MPAAPPLTQIIGRTERALSPLMDRVLARTGGTFPQWVALTFTAGNGDGIERPELIARLAGALELDDTAADQVIGGLADEQLLRMESESAVAPSDAGRDRYAPIRAAIDQIPAAPVTVTDAGRRRHGEIRGAVTRIIQRLWGDLPAEDLATAGRVLSTVLARADAELAAG